MKPVEISKSNEKIKQKKSLIRDYIIMGAIIIVAVIALLFFPDKSGPILSVSKNYFLELIMILPAIMIIIGLFSVWIPKEMVVKYMGKTSGIKGIFVAIALGMLPTGPLYVAFPMAIALLKKGAKISNIVIFISAWACIKLPQELVEIQFLGIEFALLRLALTIIFVIIMGIIIEKIIDFTDRKNIKIQEGA
ncbi:MAG: permease [Actinobacteria bacterium]|nr:permease [Actinomycetota bacterium]